MMMMDMPGFGGYKWLGQFHLVDLEPAETAVVGSAENPEELPENIQEAQ